MAETHQGTDLALLDEPDLEGVRQWGKVLRRRSRNREGVRRVQLALARVGLPLVADGSFGPATERAVIAFQRSCGLGADGVVGSRTLYALADAIEDGVQIASAEPPRPSDAVPGIYNGDKFPGKVALTFDDGPIPRTTPGILDTLAAHDVQATFFVKGSLVTQFPDVVRRAVDEGHTVANHSWDHPALGRIGVEQVRSQLARTEEAIDRAAGPRPGPRIMRPPYGDPFFGSGARRDRVAKVLRDEGYHNILWTMDPEDWRCADSPRRVLSSTRQQLKRPGAGVLLLHDIHRQTEAALPDVLDHIDELGLQVVGLDELLQAKIGTAAAS